MAIVTKILVFLFVFALLDVVKEALILLASYMTDRKFEITTTRQILLGASLSYIFTIIFTGFSLM